MTKIFKNINTLDIFIVFCLFVGLITSNNTNDNRFLTEESPKVSSPSSFDWRSYTTITPVKDQADCNAYYAFSTIAFF